MIWIDAAFALIFGVCIVWAAISDVSGLRIRNEISLALAAAFVVYALLPGTGIDLWRHLMIGGIVLAVTFGLFALHWLGGGDAKLIPAVSLWMGPDHILGFIVTLAIAGGVLALLLLLLRGVLLIFPAVARGFPLPVIASWARHGICPYAVPIAIAALLEAPQVFFR